MIKFFFSNLRLIFNNNKYYISTIFIIFILGIFSLYSSTNQKLYPFVLKQVLYFSVFSTLLLYIISVNKKIFIEYGYWIYIFSVLLLLYNNFFGRTIMGATRWANLFFFTIQPSEVAKLGIILCITKYIHQSKNNISYKDVLVLFGIITIPTILIALQPDLGSAVILFFIGVLMIFFIGVNFYIFVFLFFLGVLSIPLLWKYYLFDYQKQRIIVYIKGDTDKLNSGYNINQSKIAIGSGGLYGKGYFKGSQNKLSYIPEKHTDFIFSVFAEERGFLFCLLLIILYTFLVLRNYYFAFSSNIEEEKIIFFAVGTIIFFHVFINIAMTTGLVPVVGIPLILFSYGGSMLVVSIFFLFLTFRLNNNNSYINNY